MKNFSLDMSYIKKKKEDKSDSASNFSTVILVFKIFTFRIHAKYLECKLRLN